jgi:2-polyprenyl-6-methoxyphenol hydroxylase-like FAD-dependent oxidoreductase
VVGDGVMLAGDAAGLAYPQSGEGIRPAIESGLLAAAAVVAAGGCYDRDRLQPYDTQLRARFGAAAASPSLSALAPERLAVLVARPLLQMPAFVRHVVLDRWFLHRREPALAS